MSPDSIPAADPGFPLDHLVRVNQFPPGLFRQQAADRGFTAAGHADQDPVFRFPRDGTDYPFLFLLRNRLPEEELCGGPSLGYQHRQPVDGGNALCLRLQDQRGAGRVVNHVRDALQPWQLVRIHRGDTVLRIHAHRRRVDQPLRVRVAAQVLIVVLPAPGDHPDVSGPQVFQADHRRLRGPAAAQHQALRALRTEAGPLQQGHQSGVVRVVSPEAPVRRPENRVHGADPLRPVRDFVQQGHDRLFVGNRHVDPAEIPLFQEFRQFLRRQLDQPVVISAQLPVNLRRKAVPQLLPQQPVLHLSPFPFPFRSGWYPAAPGPPPPPPPAPPAAPRRDRASP